jgi:hypothetical protein
MFILGAVKVFSSRGVHPKKVAGAKERKEHPVQQGDHPSEISVTRKSNTFAKQNQGGLSFMPNFGRVSIGPG